MSAIQIFNMQENSSKRLKLNLDSCNSFSSDKTLLLEDTTCSNDVFERADEDQVLQELSKFAAYDSEPTSYLEQNLAYDIATTTLELPLSPTSGNSTLLPKIDTYQQMLSMYPSGLKLWRETSVGQCLIEVLDELIFENILKRESSKPILDLFDKVMTLKLPKTYSTSILKITSGNILQYKNIDGTWVFYITDFSVKLKKLIFSSPLIRIVAAELPTLQRELQHIGLTN